MKHSVCVAMILLTLTGSAWTQTAGTGTVIGSVTDSSTAVVPGAKIELRDVATGIARSAVTNNSGQYTFVGDGVPAETVELGIVDGPAANAPYAVQEVRSVGVASGSGQ